MSGRLCFVCNQPNYNGNETVMTVRRKKYDQETGAKSTLVWEGMICDSCISKCFPELEKVVNG